MNYINLVLAVAFLFAAVSASPVKDSKHQEHHHGKNETHGHLNATTPAPGLNGTTLAPLLNGTTLAPELNGTTPAPGLNATTLEPSLNGTTIEPSLNATTPSPDLNGTTLAPTTVKTTPASIKRVKRDCKSKDFTKFESKLSLFLEQEFEKLLNGSADLSNVSSGKPLKKGSTETPILTNGHQGPVAGELDGAPGKPGLPDSMDSMHEMEGASGAPGKPGKPDSMDSMHEMEGNSGAPGKPGKPDSMDSAHDMEGAPGAPGGSEITAQNVAAKANKHNGNAVAQAIAKRAATTAQNVSADAHNAVSNAEIHKGAFNNVQTVGSSGNQTGIANALIENQNGSGLNLQDVTATGGNAAASASINKPGEKNFQSSIALGTDSAIASSNISHDVAAPTKSAPKRAACLPFKMDDNVREYIHHMVKKAIKDLKKDLDA